MWVLDGSVLSHGAPLVPVVGRRASPTDLATTRLRGSDVNTMHGVEGDEDVVYAFGS